MHQKFAKQPHSYTLRRRLKECALSSRPGSFFATLRAVFRDLAQSASPIQCALFVGLFVCFVPFFDEGQNLFSVALRRDFRVDMQQRAVRADHKGGSLNAHDFLAVHVLFLQHAKLIADFLVYISKECVRKVEFGAELGLFARRVAADAQNHGAGRLKLS